MTAAVYSQYGAGHVVRLHREKIDRIGDLLRSAELTERDLFENFFPSQQDSGIIVVFQLSRPQNRAGCDAIDSHTGRKFSCECLRHRLQRRLCNAVDRMPREWFVGVGVNQIYNRSMVLP